MNISYNKSQNSIASPILIIDGYSLIFRAYYGQNPLTTSSGLPVGAIYGFISMLLKIINKFQSNHIIIALDHYGKNFRHDLYKEYKANRSPTPDDLITQLQLIPKILDTLNLPFLSKDGFEADDIIATIATYTNQQAQPSVIISSDKDLMQLIDNHTMMYDPAKAKYITSADVITKFGVGPNQVRAVQALMGDTSDNIPGVRGIGIKTASLLINKFGTIDNLFDSIEQVTNSRHQKLLTTYKEDAFMSWKLVGLDTNVPLKIANNLENFYHHKPTNEAVSRLLYEYELKSLHKRIEHTFKIQIQDIKINNNTHNIINDTNISSNALQIINISNATEYNLLFTEAQQSGVVALHPEEDRIILFSDIQDNLYSVQSQNYSLLNDLLNDQSIKKITFNIKEILKLYDGKVRSCDDLQIMHYIISAGTKSKNLGEILEYYTEYQVNNLQEIHDIKYFTQCYHKLMQKLIEHRSLYLYEEIDLPIAAILYQMENTGILVNSNALNTLSEEFAEKLIALEQQITELAGESFNIASPKQLGYILFDKLKLPFAKISRKSNTYSTNVDILEKLHDAGYKIADLILQYRHFSKLKNTYTDTLPKQINQNTGRVHTTFLQTVTSTGRLSSSNPNLQNIPTRTAEGNKIKSAFVASKDCKFISADYSQIELRVLSQVANVQLLKQALRNNTDIHKQTASQIFAIPVEQITQDLRYKAKAINFGIIYGISAFGLAKQLQISRNEASQYIDKYFAQYPEIQQYMNDIVDYARHKHYVTNSIGRKTFIPSINDKNHALKSFSERAAINAPMQSLTSDIVKIAMIMINDLFIKNNLKATMLLQIHDELIFESPVNEVAIVTKLIKSTMENAFELNVPIDISIKTGNNWQLMDIV